jgi:hypothetical protein
MEGGSRPALCDAKISKVMDGVDRPSPLSMVLKFVSKLVSSLLRTTHLWPSLHILTELGYDNSFVFY